MLEEALVVASEGYDRLGIRHHVLSTMSTSEPDVVKGINASMLPHVQL